MDMKYHKSTTRLSRRDHVYERIQIFLKRSCGSLQVNGHQSCQSSNLEVKIEFCHSAWFGTDTPARAEQFFFQTSNFDCWQLCSPLTYRDLQYLFGKISIVQSTLKVFHHSSKYPNFNGTYLVRVPLSSCIAVYCGYDKSLSEFLFLLK